jgi:hypothetical protein
MKKGETDVQAGSCDCARCLCEEGRDGTDGEHAAGPSVTNIHKSLLLLSPRQRDSSDSAMKFEIVYTSCS